MGKKALFSNMQKKIAVETGYEAMAGSNSGCHCLAVAGYSLEVGGGCLPEESQEEGVVGRALHTHCLRVEGL